MRIWSILWIKSVLKWCIHLSRSLFFIFQLLGKCHCWWTKESPRAHVAKFYCRFWLIRRVWEHQNFPCSKLIEIVILWVYYTIPFGFSLFRYFWDIVFPLLNYFVWQGITDEGSVPEMRIWSILCKSSFVFIINRPCWLTLRCYEIEYEIQYVKISYKIKENIWFVMSINTLSK